MAAPVLNAQGPHDRRVAVRHCPAGRHDTDDELQAQASATPVKPSIVGTDRADALELPVHRRGQRHHSPPRIARPRRWTARLVAGTLGEAFAQIGATTAALIALGRGHRAGELWASPGPWPPRWCRMTRSLQPVVDMRNTILIARPSSWRWQLPPSACCSRAPVTKPISRLTGTMKARLAEGATRDRSRRYQPLRRDWAPWPSAVEVFRRERPARSAQMTDEERHPPPQRPDQARGQHDAGAAARLRPGGRRGAADGDFSRRVDRRLPRRRAQRVGEPASTTWSRLSIAGSARPARCCRRWPRPT